MKNTIIKVENLTKSFKKKEVLKGVSFTVKEGQIFSLLGSNGAGKTTAVKILSTLLGGDGGKVFICGHDLFKNPAKVREVISLTGQYAAVDENLTGRENLHLIGRLKKLDGYREKANYYLNMFELSGSADRRINTYSGGMKRKLDIAMSLLGDPKIIFLDEPTTGLDPQSRIALWDLIKRLSADGITIFLTTQYLEEAEALSDYIVVLNDGVVIAGGEADELKANLPKGTIEAGFNHRAEMNAAAEVLNGFDAVVDEKARTVIIKTDSGIEVLSEVIGLFKKHGISPISLEKKSASLEDVYLHLIGGGTKNIQEQYEGD